MSELLQLAERCEAATGPDRLIDAETWRHINGVKVYHALTPKGEVSDHVPRYTASIDAAMTLVPEGAGFTAQQLGHPCFWTIFLPGGAQHEGRGHTPALALCSAALRARNHDSERGGG